MTISWFGQSCFRIEAKEGSLLIDPFSKEIGLRPPKIRDDLVLVTHAHYDHNHTEGTEEGALIIANPGEYERKGVAVLGIRSFHDRTSGAERGLNTIFVIKAEDMTVCHLGDIGQETLTEEQVEMIGDVDVLMVPVGGTFTVGSKEAAAIVSQIEPKVIIPMHYKIQGLAIKELDGPEKFVKEIGLSPEKTEKYRIVKKNLPVDETKLVILTA
ncbi:MAG: MBL fold metallo-hydrolase [Patescibacteria group bacterium]